jgi:hypothetical protein
MNTETKFDELQNNIVAEFPELFVGDADGDGDSDDSGNSSGTTSGGTGGDSGSTSNTNKPQLTSKQKDALAKALAKQKDFVNGKIKKAQMTKEQSKKVEAIESSDMTQESVKVEYNQTRWDGTSRHYSETIPVTVINKITDSTNSICSMVRDSSSRSGEEAVNSGFRLGKMLAKKLQVRNDDVTVHYNRQNRGKIERRILAELGVGNTKIFESKTITTARNAGIHISIDASGSMSGTRFNNTIKTATAIAVAMEAVGNIRVRIDFRTHDSGPGPTVLVAYDSRKNTVKHIKKYFPRLNANGGTPEGICFKAIEKLITAERNTRDIYFINFSDGEPSTNAIQITTNTIRSFKRSGLKVMSYFIGSNNQRSSVFDTMYGTDSTVYIDTNNITEVAKTVNRLLMARA